MAVTLTTHGGMPALEIEDHKGRTWLYRFRVNPRQGGWAAALEKIDPETGEAVSSYAVAELVPGQWQCDCKDFACRRQKKGEVCKHIEAARQLRQLLESLHSDR